MQITNSSIFYPQFCSTRKSTQQAAELLVKDMGSTYVKTYFQKQALQTCANSLKDNKLRGTVISNYRIQL